MSEYVSFNSEALILTLSFLPSCQTGFSGNRLDPDEWQLVIFPVPVKSPLNFGLSLPPFNSLVFLFLLSAHILCASGFLVTGLRLPLSIPLRPLLSIVLGGFWGSLVCACFPTHWGWNSKQQILLSSCSWVNH